MKRIPYGTLKDLTPEERLQHKHQLQKNWRTKNKEKVKAYNHKMYLYHKEQKPFIAVCAICNNAFNATRDYYQTCPKCIKERHNNYVAFVEKRKSSAKKREILYKKVLDLRAKGWTQMDIANKLNIAQSRVSYICVTRSKK